MSTDFYVKLVLFALGAFLIGGLPDIQSLILCVAFTLRWARIASKIANRSDAKTLNRVVGIVMIVTSIVILAVNYL